MAPRKRARTASAAAATPKLTLSGGEPYPLELVSLWRDARFTDIVVCAEGVECKAHRIVLASSSGYFRSRFDSGMRDAADHTHSLEGMRAPVLRAVLAFLYEGSCEIEESQLTEMLDASARLMVEPLKAACAAMMAAQLSPTNALEVWRIADAFSLQALEKAAVESALGGFEELPPQLASGTQVLALVQEDRLEAKSEEAVFQWIKRWWGTSERPEAELLAVLKHVRFATMEESFLRDTVRVWPPLFSWTHRHGVLSKSVAPVIGGSQSLPRQGFGPRLIYLVGGVDDEARGDEEAEEVSTVLAFDPALDSWCEVSSMAIKRGSHAIATLAGKLYAMGGKLYEETTLAQAEVYDPKADVWQPLPNMPTARYSLAAAAVAGKVYAIGGQDFDDDRCVAVEAYDPLSGAWTRAASLSVARSSHTATSVGGKIYVLGGEMTKENQEEEEYITTDRVDVYDPVADSWQQMAAMPTARSQHSAAFLDGKIYVSGGNNCPNALEAYDPVADTWTTLANLSTGRMFHTSAVVSGKLCVIGGWSPYGGRMNLVEIYTPASNSWARAADLPSAIDMAQAVAI